MRLIIFAIALSLSTSVLAEEKAPKLPEASQACLECHTAAPAKGGQPSEGVDPALFVKSVHGDLACTDCHDGYKPPGPHDLPPLGAAEAALAQKLAKRSPAPRALLACGNCHPGVMDDIRASVHGKWIAGDRPVAGPTCVSCHGSPHAITKAEGATTRQRNASVEGRARSKRCEACHGDPAFAEKAGLSAEVAVTYHDSIHGRLVAIGSDRAPGCSDCHGSHRIVSKLDPSSPVGSLNKAKTCGKCHQGANDNFAAVISHRPITEGKNKVPHFVHVAFSYLTTLTLLFFAFHVLVDFIYELRLRLRRRSDAEAAAEDHARRIVRFDIHQRIQHWLMLSGVIILGLTGWPLRGAGSPEAIETSRKFLALFGGPHGAGIVHRAGAVLIILSSIYHMFYLTFLTARKRLPLSMAPTLKDATDIRDNILFMLGLKKERPRFDRFSYLEKFDYWAIFWGIPMMVGTGFIFWFPVQFSHIVPHWALTAAQIIHGEEATLAILFLFVVHFYNVHLKPSIFPMNWTWLNGQISLENLKEEHPLEYERMLASEKDHE